MGDKHKMRDQSKWWEISDQLPQNIEQHALLSFRQLKSLPWTVLRMTISTVEAIYCMKNHVNISTDKHCSLGIRQVLYLARMQSYWQVCLCWTHPNISTVCTVVWISGLYFDVLLGGTKKATLLPMGLLHQTSWNPENTRSFWLSFCLSLLPLSPSPSSPIFLFHSLPNKNRVEWC